MRQSIRRSVSTAVNGAKLSFEIVMKKLFANGEHGFYQDPYDLGVMFQDAAGTTAVNASGQPLGLVLDKSKGLMLGSNLVRNGDFSDGATSWVARANTQLSIVDGSLRVSAIASGIGYGVESTLVSATVASKMYRFSAEVYRTNTSNPVYVRGASNTALGRNTSFNVIELGGSSSLAFVASQAGVVAGEYFEIDNVSIKEIAGSHAYQTTSAARPILQDAPKRIDFDAVDDKLITTLPTQLTGCTVIRSVPNVGTQILTGQTIPATYNDSTDHCGLIVINRALTPSETSVITTEFNERAGV
ncbi:MULTISPECIES: hypothetical protein [unclassified Acinetobacter]|uniref:hypothetical protein n=1 Tax=unclassified Acinetobacter TaxID=196816 RepID=UPI0015D37D99|nr:MULTISPECIES: hypothetical protein [unclassified Acinetobacter]